MLSVLGSILAGVLLVCVLALSGAAGDRAQERDEARAELKKVTALWRRREDDLVRELREALDARDTLRAVHHRLLARLDVLAPGVEGHGKGCTCLHCGIARALEDVSESADMVLLAFLRELREARAKHPGNARMLPALGEEFGELCRAVLDADFPHATVEALQTAVVAFRIADEGDDSWGQAPAESRP